MLICRPLAVIEAHNSKTMAKQIVFLFILLNSIVVLSQHVSYNKEFKYEIINNKGVLKKSDSIQALIVNFDGTKTKKFCKSLKNNPQLKEVQLYNPTQGALDYLSEIISDSLTHLFIVGFDTNLYLPSFPNLELLSIKADSLITLDMSNSDINSLDILNIESENLSNWKTKTEYKRLGLIDMDTPRLSEFPIKSLPTIMQFSIYCSFNEFPIFLCECVELELISFKNYKVIEVDECFKQKIYNGFYSNLTIKDGKDGPIILEWLSKDRQ